MPAWKNRARVRQGKLRAEYDLARSSSTTLVDFLIRLGSKEKKDRKWALTSLVTAEEVDLYWQLHAARTGNPHLRIETATSVLRRLIGLPIRA